MVQSWAGDIVSGGADVRVHRSRPSPAVARGSRPPARGVARGARRGPRACPRFRSARGQVAQGLRAAGRGAQGERVGNRALPTRVAVHGYCTWRLHEPLLADGLWLSGAAALHRPAGRIEAAPDVRDLLASRLDPHLRTAPDEASVVQRALRANGRTGRAPHSSLAPGVCRASSRGSINETIQYKRKNGIRAREHRRGDSRELSGEWRVARPRDERPRATHETGRARRADARRTRERAREARPRREHAGRAPPPAAACSCHAARAPPARHPGGGTWRVVSLPRAARSALRDGRAPTVRTWPCEDMTQPPRACRRGTSPSASAPLYVSRTPPANCFHQLSSSTPTSGGIPVILNRFHATTETAMCASATGDILRLRVFFEP